MFVFFLLKRPGIIFHSGGLIPKINRVACTSRAEVIWYFLYMNISLSFAVPDSSILLIMVYCQQIKWFSQFRFLRFQSRDGRGSIFGRAKAKICKLEPASHPLNLKLPGLTLLHSPLHLSSPRPCFLPTKLHSIARRLLQTGDSVEVAIAGAQCCQSRSLNSWSWKVVWYLFALTVKIVKHDFVT